MRLVLMVVAGVIVAGLTFAAGTYFAPSPSAGKSPGTSLLEALPTVARPAPAPVASTATLDLPTILKESNSYRMLKDVTAYADGLSAADLPKAVETVSALPPGNGNAYQALTVLAGRWVELDPKAAAAAVQTSTNPQMGNVLASDVFSSLTTQNSAEAWKQAEALPAGPKRAAAEQSVISKMAETDSAAAFKLAASIPNLQRRNESFLGIINAIAQTDPDKALAQAQQLSPGQMRDQAVGAALGRLAEKDPAHALAISQSMKTANGRNSLNQIFNTWAGKDTAAATQAALRLTNRQERSQAISSIMSQLAQKDPATAQAWLNQVPAGPERNQAEQTLVANLAGTNPAAAADYISALPNGQQRSNLVQSIAYQWAQTDVTAALAWMEKLPPSQGKEIGLQQVASIWAQNDRQAAAAFVTGLAPSQERVNMLRTLPVNGRRTMRPARSLGPRGWPGRKTAKTHSSKSPRIGYKMIRKPRWPSPLRFRREVCRTMSSITWSRCLPLMMSPLLSTSSPNTPPGA